MLKTVRLFRVQNVRSFLTPRAVTAILPAGRDPVGLVPRYATGDASPVNGNDVDVKPKTFKELARTKNFKSRTIHGSLEKRSLQSSKMTKSDVLEAKRRFDNWLQAEAERETLKQEGRLIGSRELVQLTWSQAFFFGHPNRRIFLGFSILLPFFVRIILQQGMNFSPEAGASGLFLTLALTSDFFLSRICTNIYYDSVNDIYHAIVPFSFNRILTYKRLHVKEIKDSKFSTISVRGRKLFVPRELFTDPADFDAMVPTGNGERDKKRRGTVKKGAGR